MMRRSQPSFTVEIKRPPRFGASGAVAAAIPRGNYFDSTSNIINRWKKASYPTLFTTDGTKLGAACWIAGLLSPTTGELVTPASSGGVSVTAIQRMLLAPGGAGRDNWDGEKFWIDFDGQGTPTIGGLTSGNTPLALAAPNKWSFTLGTDAGNTWVYIAVTNVNNPPRNIRVYQDRYKSAIEAGLVWVPEWLDEINRYGSLRVGPGLMEVNNEEITHYSQLAGMDYDYWFTNFRSGETTAGAGPIYDAGPRGSMGPDLVASLAIAAGVSRVHMSIHHKATDACVTSIATYMRDHAGLQAAGIIVTYEYTNEPWNDGFQQSHWLREQGQALWPDDYYRNVKMGAYRAAQVMRIIHNVYGPSNRHRWQGALGIQTGNLNNIDWNYEGIDLYLSHAPGVVTSDLFNDLYATGYFGDVMPARPIANISKSNPAVITIDTEDPNAVPANGSKWRVSLHPDDGMAQIDSQYITAGSRDTTAKTIQCVGVNSTSYANFTGVKRNAYLVPEEFGKLMTESTTANESGSIYKLFNRIMAQAMMTGEATSPGGIVIKQDIGVLQLRRDLFPAIKAKAASRGLGMSQYEGGCHFVGNVYVTGYPGANSFGDLFNPWLVQLGHSPEVAECYRECFKTFIRAGGHHPSKFVLDGATSRYGTWGGIRYPRLASNGGVMDLANPVVTVMHEFNEQSSPDTYKTVFLPKP